MKIRIDPLDKLFSEYVRKRAMYRCGGCERCGSKKSSYKELQCAHFHGRRKRSTRYHEDNACALCYGCHSYIDGNPLEKIEFFQKLLGDDKFDGINYIASHPKKPDKEAIKLYLEQKIKELPSTYVIIPNKKGDS